MIIMRVYEVVLIFSVLHKEKLFSFQKPYEAEISKVSLPRFLSRRWAVEIQNSISIDNSQCLAT